MTTITHPARQYDFDALVAGLNEAREARAVYAVGGPEDLLLWRYSEHCVFDKLWTPISLLARGLILDMVERRIVATPFPKFFNLGEDGEGLPDLPFEVFEKLDGSLIIIFHHRGRWKTATKGSFVSSQAEWAANRLASLDLSVLDTGSTYLAEAVYPENRIVVAYDDPALVMLGAYREDGTEFDYNEVQAVSAQLGWRAAYRTRFESVDAMMTHVAGLPRSEEGFVLRFEDGSRLKIKGAEYRRIHALISRVTPLAVWEMMLAKDDLDGIRRELPEELWTDFDTIRELLSSAYESKMAKTKALVAELAGQTDKEVGLKLSTFDQDIRSFIFPCRKDGDAFPKDKTRETMLRHLRPTGNELDGYTPSHAMNRIMEEAM